MIIAPGNSDRVSGTNGVDLAGFARFIVKEFGVNGIEPLLHSHFASTAPGEIERLRRSFDEAGVFTCNIPVDEPADLCSVDPAVRQRSYEMYRKWVDIAVQLASPSIRISMPACETPSDIESVAKALRPIFELCDFA